jgi:hypothetical protein
MRRWDAPPALEFGDETLGLVLIAIALFVFFAARASGILSPHRRRFRVPDRFPRRFPVSGHVPRRDITDANEQLRAVMAAPFEKRRVLSTAEYRVFKIVEDDLASQRPGFRVFAQTSLGEVLQSSSSDAFFSINSKRADILVIDPRGWPVLAIEYQGSGHYQGTAAVRDAVKREALRKAGVGYVEIDETDSNDQIRYRVREELGVKVDTRAALSPAPVSS